MCDKGCIGTLRTTCMSIHKPTPFKWKELIKQDKEYFWSFHIVIIIKHLSIKLHKDSIDQFSTRPPYNGQVTYGMLSRKKTNRTTFILNCCCIDVPRNRMQIKQGSVVNPERYSLEPDPTLYTKNRKI